MTRRQAVMTVSALVLVIAGGVVLTSLLAPKRTALSGPANELLPRTSVKLGEVLKYDEKKRTFIYNEGYVPSSSLAMNSDGQPRIGATLSADDSVGLKVTDPVGKFDMQLRPLFALADPHQQKNRLVYPLRNGADGALVYTAQVSGVKEDIVLEQYRRNRMSFDYELTVPKGTQARLEKDGSIGVYASELPINDEVSTGSEKDAALLEKVRDKSKKSRLVFTIPKPVVIETNKTKSSVKASFALKGNQLTVTATGLKGASYPLSIDPSVYVETAQKLMRGNNETNLDFDVANELIQKGELTGARFNEITSTLSLPAARWGHATAAMGGYMYVTGGNDGTANQQTVYWSKFNTTTNALDSPNPGNGPCSNWCTSAAYNLPAARAGHSMVAYNGFLYVLGGVDGSGARTSTVYIAKIGTNGEPSLWHPTDSNTANWVHWYESPVTLTSARSYAAAAAYNNRLYLLGGQTDTSTGGVATMEYANLTPRGTISSWSSTGMTALPSVRHSHAAQIYNDRLYLIGGNSGGTLQNTVDYIKIRNDGTLVSSWASANSFATARQSWGGNFSTIWGGYLYISGGCAEISAGGQCTSTGITNGGSVELASLNADGSVSNWGRVGNITNARIGYGLVGWRNTLYMVGGCTSQDATTSACTATSTGVGYGVLNQDGDVSTVAVTQAAGAGTCVDPDPYGCDLPPLGDGPGELGQMLTATAIMNGYLYVIGGCADHSTTVECSAVDAISSNVAYAAISSDGSLRRSPSCAGVYYGSWCVDDKNVINGTSGVAAAGITVFEGRIYVVGGLDNTVTGANKVFSIGVNSDGSLDGPWSEQTFADLNITGEIAYTFAYARANPSAAATYPGTLFIFGGCGEVDTGVGCNGGNYRSEVYKCNIKSGGLLEDADGLDCTTSGQLQIDVELSDEPNQGLGLHSGAVYANYIYLMGGVSAGVTNRNTVFYAKFDNNNNVVDVDSGTADLASATDDWIPTSEAMKQGRMRGASFGYNGYLYALGGVESGTSPGAIERAKINVSTGDIEPFTVSSVSVDQRWGLNLIVSNSYVYVIGGCNSGTSPSGCTSFQPSLHVTQVYNNDSGTPAGYSSSSNRFATDRFGAGSVIHNGYIYIAGGCIATTDCTDATNSVQYAPLNPDGTVGAWAATTALLPADRAFGQMEMVGGSFYFIGGQGDDEVAQASVFFATPAANGDISAWSSATNSLPAARTKLSAAVWNNRMYVIAGEDGAKAATNTIYVSPQQGTGGDITAAWSSPGTLPVARSGHAVIAYANNLYVLGGYTGTVPLSDVQFTKINPDGTIGTWTYTTSLPQRIRGSDGFAANGYMYLFGGKLEDTTCNNNTYVAPISANTTIASGNNPTGVGEWFVTNKRFNAERAAVTAVYGDGKAYVLGGACGSLPSLGSTVAMADDIDPGIDTAMWSNLTRMTAGTTCGTLHAGNALHSQGSNGANVPQAATKSIDITYGGTISFYLRIPTTAGTCDPPEAGEDVLLQYSKDGGSTWTTFSTYTHNGYNTPTLIEETVPSAAYSGASRFRWIIPQASNGSDMFALDTVSISANTAPPLTQIFSENFDPINNLNWTSLSGMTVGTTCGPVGTGDGLYSSGGTSNAVSKDVDLRFGGTVDFRLRIPTNSGGGCAQAGAGKDLHLQYSTTSGSSWTTFATYDRGAYNTPQKVSAVIPDAAKSQAVRFRWIIPNGAAGADMWAVDDVAMNAFQSVLTFTNANRVVFSTLMSQAQVARYSRMIDTDTDVFPTKWLMNGLDNDIGARWRMRYRSSTNAAADWGQETNFGRVTLGQPENYIPLDGSGTNTNFARYYYMSVGIDASQAFGYPEDVSRGPTIDDLTLFFTSDPSKRMRHGKTFTGGEKQPLDTPFP